ncbi:MAG TPA: hypothetical protein VIQ80_03240, partial [Candidatus Saccharimonadales bacterium]
AESYPGQQNAYSVSMPYQKVNDVLGLNLTPQEIAAIMQNVEFTVTDDKDAASIGIKSGNVLSFTPPYWRADIHIAEDVIEEIGRLYGFDAITPTLPHRDFTAVRPSHFDALRSDIRKALSRAGANEVLTYSFVHGDLLIKAGQKTEDSYRLVNSLSPELQYYRQTITPSLLSIIHGNIKQGYDHFAVYEVNKAHPKQHGMTNENVPAEVDMVALTVANKKSQQGAAYYEAKRMLEYLAKMLGLELVYSPLEADPNYPVAAPFEHRRAALVTDKKTNTMLGIVGEYKRSVVKAFKLPDYTAGFEIGSIPVLEAVQRLTSDYRSVSRYPGTERDICFQVPVTMSFQKLNDAAWAALKNSPLETSVEPVDIYQPEGATTKNVTLRISLTSHKKTLTGDEVTNVINSVAAHVTSELGAAVI